MIGNDGQRQGCVAVLVDDSGVTHCSEQRCLAADNQFESEPGVVKVRLVEKYLTVGFDGGDIRSFRGYFSEIDLGKVGGAEEIRTPDPLTASQDRPLLLTSARSGLTKTATA